MVPGRSLSANTGGRSIAPVASTICFARIRHTRWPRSDRDRVVARIQADDPCAPECHLLVLDSPSRSSTRPLQCPRPRGPSAPRPTTSSRSARASCRSVSRRREQPTLARERLGNEPFLEGDERRTDHRLRADLHERVRLLFAGGVDAAWTGAIERRKPPRTPFRTSAAASVSPSRPSYPTPAKRNLNLIPRLVSRTISNQRRQPCVCTQRSVKRPLGLSRTKRYARPLLVGGCRRVGRVGDLGLAAVRELGLVALAAPGTADEQHQCATPAAPCSSISAPVTKRSSENGAFSSCGSPWASVQANVQPDPGVALKPPVPQPQLRKNCPRRIRSDPFPPLSPHVSRMRRSVKRSGTVRR